MTGATRRRAAPFGTLPAADPDALSEGTRACLLGGRYRGGSPHGGAENGPFFVRTASKVLGWPAEEPVVLDVERGRPAGDAAVDLGDLDFGDLPPAAAVGLVEKLVGGLPPGVAPCLVGGDHSLTAGVVAGLAARHDRPFRVVQFDQHLDLQLWDGLDPGRHRDPLFHTNVMSHVVDRLGPGSLLQVGVAPFTTVERTWAPAALDHLHTAGTRISASSPVLADPARFLAAVGRGGDLYVTVDLDVLDATVMASTGYPAAGGIPLTELLRLLDLTARHNRIIGFDVVEFCADAADRSPTTIRDAARAAAIVMHLLDLVCRDRR